MDIKKSQAFTMLEIIVVIFIIGVIMAAVGPRIAKYWGQAAETEAKLKIQNIVSALNDYRAEFGVFPSTKEGLRALVENPRPNDETYKKAERARKWPFVANGEEGITDKKTGEELIYHCPPERYKDKYRFYEILWIGNGTEDDPQLDGGA